MDISSKVKYYTDSYLHGFQDIHEHKNKQQIAIGSIKVFTYILSCGILPFLAYTANFFASLSDKKIDKISVKSTTDPVDGVKKAIEIIKDQKTPTLELSSNISPLLPERKKPSFISVESRLENFKSIDGCKIYGENEEQVEIALLGERVGRDTIFSPWKLHISANPENAGQILKAIEDTLLLHKPHFKFIKNEDLIEEYNNFVNSAFPERGLFKEGKFITIYAKDETEVLTLAKDLDFALQNALNEGHINVDLLKPAICRTDRPIGSTGLLWARHDQAGSPITDVDYREGTHAAASVGNYNQTTYFPIDWAFDYEPNEMEEKIRTNADGVHSTTHKDIFVAEWSAVEWNSKSQRFENQQ